MVCKATGDDSVNAAASGQLIDMNTQAQKVPRWEQKIRSVKDGR